LDAARKRSWTSGNGKGGLKQVERLLLPVRRRIKERAAVSSKSLHRLFGTEGATRLFLPYAVQPDTDPAPFISTQGNAVVVACLGRLEHNQQNEAE
jgi:hypothetical protein